MEKKKIHHLNIDFLKLLNMLKKRNTPEVYSNIFDEAFFCENR